MGVLAFVKVAPSGNNDIANGNSVTITKNVIGSPITIGHNNIVRLVAVGANVFVRFGAAGTTSAGITDVLLCSHVPEVFDMGRYNEVIVPFYDGVDAGTTAILYYHIVAKN